MTGVCRGFVQTFNTIIKVHIIITQHYIKRTRNTIVEHKNHV